MEAASLTAPQAIGDTGIRKGLLEDLAVKVLFIHGETTLVELADRMCLSLGAIEEIFQYLRKEQLCEVKGMTRGTHRIAISANGKMRAAELLAMNQYAGPAPVSLMDYTLRVHSQSVQQTEITAEGLERAFHDLVLSDELLARLGTAIVSGTSIFLYGPPGTGKTSIAANIPGIFNDHVLIPHAVEVDDQIIALFDPGVHRPLERRKTADDADRRWVLCRRPRVVAGGELSAEMLDLQINTVSRFYTAPLQMKANNGMLLLDDFGRQRMRPGELLNRWMTPLDRRMDYLSLSGGKKFAIPFDVCLVFATNLNPRDLADDAFLRRIPNKIKVGHATPEQFKEIFADVCATRLLSYDVGLPDFVVQHITREMKQPLCQCYARDLIDQVIWAAAYQGVEPRLSRSSISQACRNYFLSTDAI
jgi:predicted ATPase with chaperone activity